MVGKLPENGAVEILRTEGDWYHIKSGEVEGYVSAEFIVTGSEALAKANEVATNKAKVTADAVHVRLEANTDSAILSNVFSGDELEVIAELGDWVQVNVDGETGYISAEFVECGIALPDAMTMSEARYGEGVSDVRVDLVNYALQFVGNPYVWGGTSLTHGADCSGFVLSIYSKYGISLPHSSRAQANYGTRVSTSELQPGDLLFYGSGGISHVAIYIGGGQIVHASTETTGIIVSNAFYRNPICCTSLLN
jgi:cell wall-associated NlpC family hydrolase